MVKKIRFKMLQVQIFQHSNFNLYFQSIVIVLSNIDIIILEYFQRRMFKGSN